MSLKQPIVLQHHVCVSNCTLLPQVKCIEYDEVMCMEYEGVMCMDSTMEYEYPLSTYNESRMVRRENDGGNCWLNGFKVRDLHSVEDIRNGNQHSSMRAHEGLYGLKSWCLHIIQAQ